MYVRDVSGSGIGTLMSNSCSDLMGGKFSVKTIIEEFTESGIDSGGLF